MLLPATYRALFHRRGESNEDHSGARSRIATLLEDLAHLVQKTAGFFEYLARRAGLEKPLRKPSTGAETRWLFYAEVIEWMLEHEMRLDDILSYLLYCWRGDGDSDGDGDGGRPPRRGVLRADVDRGGD